MVHLSFRISDKAPADLVAHLVGEGFTLRPRAIRAMLSIETLRSDRWPPAETPGAPRKPPVRRTLRALCLSGLNRWTFTGPTRPFPDRAMPNWRPRLYRSNAVAAAA